ncbi:MAG: recombination protein RecR [Alphaproteobacteria bacterium 40-19]|nr:MAG: recombination protein RecR [Alphaproteobacteria bacterium 40-19]
MFGSELQQLLQLIGKLPGLGPRSARRVVLHFLKNRQTLVPCLLKSLKHVTDRYQPCSVCGYFDGQDPCFFCTSHVRDSHTVCVVAHTGDVWALERASFFKGRYHVLGGVLSAFHNCQPSDLNLDSLKKRVNSGVKEVVMALDGNIEGQTTLHYVVQELLKEAPCLKISSLARGMPMGGELESMDQATLMSAFLGRQDFSKPL